MGVTGAKVVSVEDMRDEVINHCEKQTDCQQCVINGHSACTDYSQLIAPDDIIRDAYDKIHPPVSVVEEEPRDMVHHPDHYNREGAMECIEEMITLFGREVVKHFCLCNIHKYRYRASAKNGEEDIKKSDFYVKKYKELCE